MKGLSTNYQYNGSVKSFMKLKLISKHIYNPAYHDNINDKDNDGHNDDTTKIMD